VPVFGGRPTSVARNKGFESWATDDGTALLYSSYNTIYRLDLSRNFEQRILNLENVAFNRYWTLNEKRHLPSRSRIWVESQGSSVSSLETRTSRTVLSVSGVPDRYLSGSFDLTRWEADRHQSHHQSKQQHFTDQGLELTEGRLRLQRLSSL
jgi:hypothetical protein